MQLFTGQKVSFASGGSGGGGVLSGIGGMLGVGAIPVFGAGGGHSPAVRLVDGARLRSPAGGGSGGIGGLASAAGTGGLFSKAGFAGTLAKLKSFRDWRQRAVGSGRATRWQAATLDQKLSSIGESNAVLMGGTLLALDGLRRGGWSASARRLRAAR